MGEIKAIETVYNGYRFRSRLEARWAVFFDALGFEYDYEPEGYDLGGGDWYLPDFWLPAERLFVEIKPQEPTLDELRLARKLADQTRHNVVILHGRVKAPEVNYWLGVEDYPYFGTFLYGNFSRYFDWFTENHFESLAHFLRGNGYHVEDFTGNFDHALSMIEIDKQWYFHKHGKPHPYWHRGPSCLKMLWGPNKLGQLSLHSHVDTQYPWFWQSDRLRYAYEVAQQARFEHGETPRVRPYMQNETEVPF